MVQKMIPYHIQLYWRRPSQEHSQDLHWNEKIAWYVREQAGMQIKMTSVTASPLKRDFLSVKDSSMSQKIIEVYSKALLVDIRR